MAEDDLFDEIVEALCDWRARYGGDFDKEKVEEEIWDWLSGHVAHSRLRDEIAMRAMAALISDPGYREAARENSDAGRETMGEFAAKGAYNYADAMLIQRTKKGAADDHG